MKTNTLKNIVITGLKKAMRSAADGERPGLFNRIQVEIPTIDLIMWLKNQPHPIKFYASDRNKQYAVAGLGALDTVTECAAGNLSTTFSEIRRRIAASHQQIKYYGGLAFNPQQALDDDWAAFGNCYFLLPRFEIIVQNGQTLFAANYRNDESASTLLQHLDGVMFSEAVAVTPMPTLKRRVDLPQKQGWVEGVNRAVDLIQRTSLNKVVLSRKTSLRLSDVPSPFDLMGQLKQVSTDSFDFCLQPAPHCAFLGSTPELLYRREGRTINSEAIAGTRPRGKNTAEDRRYHAELATSRKDAQEHLLVVDNVLDTLNALCHQVAVLRRLDILQLSLVQHLYTQFRGELKADVMDEDILTALHPTPSVLGEPKQQAFSDLAHLEPYARGWYAGPFGWVGADETVFVVGIRSGLLNGHTMSLFSGAGIVAESDPDKEWVEIENKVGQLLQIFQPKATPTRPAAKPAISQSQWHRQLALG